MGLRKGCNLRQHRHSFLGILAHRRLAREHDAVGAVQDGVGHIRGLGRVGRRLDTMDSSICVAVMTGFPARLAAMSCFCRMAISSIGTSTPRSPLPP